MKNTINWIGCLTLAMFIFACGQDSHEAGSHAHDEAHATHDADHESDETTLTLNAGNKWEANPETTNGVDNMVRLVNDFTATEDPEAYKALKTDLQHEFQMIFKNCTMKGEAHNQLHNFLLPIRDLFKELESSELTTQQEALNKLKAHLATYTEFFV